LHLANTPIGLVGVAYQLPGFQERIEIFHGSAFLTGDCMTRITPDIAALVGSRICHDLISPLGAIGNGLELMAMTGGSDGPELDLIHESVGNANARIRFFRVAFGHAGGGRTMGNAEIRSILADNATGRLTYDWAIAGDCLRSEVRPVFLAILCVETALPLGGHISVSKNGGSWVVSGQGEKLAIDPALWQSLGHAEAMADLSPARVQFGLLPQAVADLGRCVSAETGETAAQISF
jgi:histidine phosphotransferase ChpT